MVVSSSAFGGIGVAVMSCSPFCPLRPSEQPPLSARLLPGSSFIMLTWETQKDFFHPRALMFSLLESRCAVLFTRYFVAAILSPPLFFFLSPFSSRVLPFSRQRYLAMLLHFLFVLCGFFFTASSRFHAAIKTITSHII